MVEGDNSSFTPITPEISVLSGVHIFLKLTGSWKRAFPYLRTFWLCFRKNTVECLGRLSCLLLRRNYKEVMSNPLTFFPLVSPLPALTSIQFYSMDYRGEWSNYTASLVVSTTNQAWFVPCAPWIHLLWASCVKRKGRSERLHKKP